MKCLFNYSIKEFIDFVETNSLDGWTIIEENLTNRYHAIKNNNKFDILNKLAQDQKLYFNKKEIITWLDSIKIMYEILSQIYYSTKTKYDINNIQIIAEYIIPFSNNRIDFMLTKDNKILLIEFSYADILEQKDRFQNKLNQVICYKELLETILPSNIEINTYSFITINEYDTDYMDKNIAFEIKINNFKKFINYFFENKNNAYNELIKLNNYQK